VRKLQGGGGGRGSWFDYTSGGSGFFGKEHEAPEIGGARKVR